MANFERSYTEHRFNEANTREARKSVHFKKDTTLDRKANYRSGASSLKKSSYQSKTYSANTSQNDSFTEDTYDYSSNLHSPEVRSGMNSSNRTSFKLQRMQAMRSEEDRTVVLLAKPLEKQYERVKEIERLAKLLEKDVEEKSKLTNINQYFEEDDIVIKDDKDLSIALKRSSLVRLEGLKPDQPKKSEEEKKSDADQSNIFKRLQTSTGNAFSKTSGAISGIFSALPSFGIGADKEEETDENNENMEHSSMHQLEQDELCMMSKVLAANNMQDTLDENDARGETYFAPNAKLNDTAMIEYGLKKGISSLRK